MLGLTSAAATAVKQGKAAVPAGVSLALAAAVPVAHHNGSVLPASLTMGLKASSPAIGKAVKSVTVSGVTLALALPGVGPTMAKRYKITVRETLGAVHLDTDLYILAT